MEIVKFYHVRDNNRIKFGYMTDNSEVQLQTTSKPCTDNLIINFHIKEWDKSITPLEDQR